MNKEILNGKQFTKDRNKQVIDFGNTQNSSSKDEIALHQAKELHVSHLQSSSIIHSNPNSCLMK